MKFIEFIIDFVVEIIAPKDPKIRLLEKITPAEFLRRANYRFDRDVLSFFIYKDDLVKTALIELKTYRNQKVADLLGAVLFEKLSEKISENKKLVIVPIPITKKKRRERGWNQCELILDGLKKTDTLDRFNFRKNILFKIRDTDDQVGKSKKERFKNLKDSFSVRDSSDVSGHDFIVFDDIVTTGATLFEARRALIAAGAKSVVCVTFAH